MRRLLAAMLALPLAASADSGIAVNQLGYPPGAAKVATAR